MRTSRKPKAGLAIRNPVDINKKETDELKETEVVEVEQSSKKEVKRRRKTSN